MKKISKTWKLLLLPALLLLGVKKVQAQTSGDFCIIGVGCYQTYEKAEVALRAQSAYAGIGQYLEQMDSTSAPPLINYRYWVKNRTAVSLNGPMFRADLGELGSGTYGCTPVPNDPIPGHECGSESNLIQKVEAFLETKWDTATNTCTVTGTTVSTDYGTTLNVVGSPTTEKSAVDYGDKKLLTTLNCTTSPTTRVVDWDSIKKKRLYCESGFRPVNVQIPLADEGRLLTDLLCAPYNDDVTSIRSPIKQCKSCAGSKNPIYPATGEKIRDEADFVFAGRVFARHYRSWRQARNNRYFGIGWTHTFSDKLDTGSRVVFSDRGDIEEFTQVGINRYRGKNSYDNILEYVNSGGVSYRLRLPGGELREFNTDGQLLRIKNLQDPSNDVTLAYFNKHLVSVTDAKGRVLSFFYTNDRVSVVQLPDGRYINYTYDANFNLTLVDYGGGDKRKYHYGEAGLVGDAEQVNKLTGISNVTGTNETRYASFGYDAQGRVISSTVHGSPDETATITYDNANEATVTTESGASDKYKMNAETYRKINEMSTGGVTGKVSRTYDANNRVTSETDRRGIITNFGYPSEYNRTVTSAVGLPEQRKREVDRNTSNLVTEVRVFNNANVLQSKTSWTYNSRGQVLTQTLTNPIDNTVRTSTSTYCESSEVSQGLCPMLGLLKTSKEFGSNNVVTYTYRQSDASNCVQSPATCLYRKGDLWKVTNSLGHVTEVVSYDGAGRVLSEKDENGVVTEFEYDSKGRTIATRLKGVGGDRVTTMTYTSTDQLKQVNNSDGTFTKYNYDSADRVTSVEDNAGNKIIYTLNGDGKVTKEEIKDAGGVLRKTLAYTYNNLSQLTEVKDAVAQSGGLPTQSMSYDSEGNVTQSVDGLSRQTSYEYDPLERVKKWIKDSSGSLPQEVNQSHNALDKVTKVKDPKNLDTDYIQNGFGDLGQVDSPDTGSTGYEYNSLGQLIEKTDGNGVVEQYTYDVLGRMITRNYEGTDIDETYTYDVSQGDCTSGANYGIGRLTRVVDGSGSTNFCYNSYGDLVKKVQRINGNTLSQSWVYGSNGQLNLMIYPNGMIVDYSYDGLGQVNEMGITIGETRQVLFTNASYYPFGPVSYWEYGNGREMKREYNLNYQPVLIEDTSPGGINYSYTYDRVGNITQLQAPGLIRNYEYDGLNRLKVVKNSSNVKLWEYTYDATGNRTSFKEGTNPTKNYTYNSSNHMLANDSLEYRNYDGAGNLREISPNGSGPGQFRIVLAYNTANRLDSVTKGSTSEMATYSYNFSGERVQRTLSTGATNYYLYNSTNLVGEYNSSGGAIQQVIWLGGMPVAVVTGSGLGAKLYYVQSDGLGTPRVVIDPARDLAVWKNPLENEPFGNSTPQENPDGDSVNFKFNLRFPGQMYDDFTGLVYNYYRDYDPSVGRYIQSDPIGLEGGISTYSYVEGNPLTATDPLGLLFRGPAVQPQVVPVKPGVIVIVETPGSPAAAPAAVPVGAPIPGVLAGYLKDFETINSAGKDKYPFTPYTPQDMYQLLYIDRCLPNPELQKPDCLLILLEVKEALLNFVKVSNNAMNNRMRFEELNFIKDRHRRALQESRIKANNQPLRSQLLNASYRLEKAVAKADKHGCMVPPDARRKIEFVATMIDMLSF